MANNDAGNIDREWHDNVAKNLDGQDRTVVDLFALVTNCPCEIDAELSVWCNGTWLNQARIDEIVAAIDRGV